MDVGELVGGVESRSIEIVQYRSEWPDAFEVERLRISRALGLIALRIDHIGSTAVPGLAAKPIVDIDVSVRDPGDEGAYVPQLLSAGYSLRVRQTGHRMLRTPDLGVHVHVCETGGEWERRHLLFRDWLRTDSDDRERYARAKMRLAAEEWPDMPSYAAAKAPIIAAITLRAEAWAASSAWATD